MKDVRKKINSLRSNYRKELKKILSSKRSGASADVYSPSSRVFYSMKFLDRFEQPVNSNVQNQKAETVSHQCFAYFNLVMLFVYFSFTLVIIVDLIIDLTLLNSALKPYFL